MWSWIVSFLTWFAILGGIGGAIYQLRWYLALVCAKYDFFWTMVNEGTVKIVKRYGAYHKTLLQKAGYKLGPDGKKIVQGQDPVSYHGGLRFIGLPFINKIYKRDLKWVKAMPDGKVEERQEKNVDFTLALVDYQYGLVFKDEEDNNLLPLSGLMTLTAGIEDPYLANFAVNSWFEAMMSRVLPRVRDCLSKYAYQQIIEDDTIQIDKEVWAALNQPGVNNNPSIVVELKDRYGVILRALEMAKIDPPDEYRKDTLAKWKAERDAEANLKKQEIDVSAFATQTSGTEVAMISKWIGVPVADLQAEIQKAIVADPEHGFENWAKKYPVIQKNWNLIQQRTLGVKPALFGNADGSALDPIVTLIALFNAARGGGSASLGEPADGGKGNNPEKGKSAVAKMTEAEKQAAYEKLKGGK